MSKTLNYDDMIAEKVPKTKYENKNSMSLQHPIGPVIMSAATGQGKTNELLNLLFTPDLKMTYTKVYLICPDTTAEEDAYQFMKMHFQEMIDNTNAKIAEFNKRNKKKHYDPMQLSDVFVHISKYEECPTLESINKKIQNIFIFDDIIDDKKLNEYATKLIKLSRKINCSVFYLSQEWTAIPIFFRKQIKNGAAFLWETPTATELRQYSQMFCLGMEPEEFKRLYDEATSVPHRPLVINFKDRVKNKQWFIRAGLEKPMLKPEPYQKQIHKVADEIEMKYDDDEN
jgi:hypothetical protein